MKFCCVNMRFQLQVKKNKTPTGIVPTLQVKVHLAQPLFSSSSLSFALQRRIFLSASILKTKMAARAWLPGIHFDCHRWVLKDVPPPFQESICCLKFCRRRGEKKESNENHLNYKRKLRNGTRDETVQFPSQGDKNPTFNLKEEITGLWRSQSSANMGCVAAIVPCCTVTFRLAT